MANTDWDSVVTKNEGNYVTNAATVTIVEGKVRICYLDKFDKDGKITKEIRFPDGKQCHIFEMKDLPLEFSAEDEGAEVILRVKSEGTANGVKIVEFLPENDRVQGRFVEFVRVNGKDTPPIPFEKRKWREDDADVLQFAPVFKIEGGAFDGKTVAMYLQFQKSGKSKAGNAYTMDTFPANNEGQVAFGFNILPNGTTGYKWSDQVYSLRHCGLLEGERLAMPEDGNPLPLFEKRLKSANKLVDLDISKGYAVDIHPIKKVSLGAKSPAPTQTAALVSDDPNEM